MLGLINLPLAWKNKMMKTFLLLLSLATFVVTQLQGMLGHAPRINPPSIKLQSFPDGCLGFAKETLVKMADGQYQSIKNLEIGSKVISFDKTQCRCCEKRVVAKKMKFARGHFILTLQDDGKLIMGTKQSLFALFNDILHCMGIMAAIPELAIYQKLEIITFKFLTDEAISLFLKKSEKTTIGLCRFWQIEVEDTHNFFVTNNDIWVPDGLD